MKVGTFLVVLACTSGAFAKEPLQTTDHIQRITDLGKKPKSLARFDELMNALASDVPVVRVAALKVFAEVGTSYFYHYKSEVEDMEGDPQQSSMMDARQLQSFIMSRVNPRPTDSQLVRLEVIRTLCKLSDDVRSICPKMMPGCGLGTAFTLAKAADQSLAQQAKTNRQMVISLVSDADPDVVWGALQSLGKDFQKTQKARMQAFLLHPNKYFRAIGGCIASQVWPEETLRMVAPLLDDVDLDVRTTGNYIIDFSQEQAFQIVLNTQLGPNVRRVAIDSLPKAKSAHKSQVLTQLLGDSQPIVRATALRHLCGDGADLAMRFLSDPSPEVQAAALGFAARHDFEGLQSIVKSGLTSDCPSLRNAALVVTADKTWGKELSPEIVRCVDLGVEYDWMAKPAFNDPSYSYLINECLESPNPNVRLLVAQYYAERAEAPLPFGTILRIARDPDAEVARIVFGCLAKISDSRAFDALVELAHSENAEISRSAMYALAASDKHAAIPVLESLTLEKKGDLRRTARYSLADLRKSLAKP